MLCLESTNKIPFVILYSYVSSFVNFLFFHSIEIHLQKADQRQEFWDLFKSVLQQNGVGQGGGKRNNGQYRGDGEEDGRAERKQRSTTKE